MMYDERGTVTARTDNHWWDCETMALVVADIKEWGRLAEPPKDPLEPVPQAADWVGGDTEW